MRTDEEPKDKETKNESLSSENSQGNLMKAGITAGLLSSSCCLLQLLLNALSWFNIVHVGCAGFNTVLGPPRPYLRAFTFGWLGVCWYNTPTKRWRTMLRATVITTILMFLPELLQTWDYAHPVIRRSLATTRIPPMKEEEWLERQIIVHNMGCEGCQSAVRNLLESYPDIERAQVDWKTGKASVFGKAVESLDMDAIGSLLERHGYELDLNMENANLF